MGKGFDDDDNATHSHSKGSINMLITENFLDLPRIEAGLLDISI